MPSRGMMDLAGCLRVIEPSWERRAAAQLFREMTHSISHLCPAAVFVNSEPCSNTTILPGWQTPSLGGRATGLPRVARAKEGQRSLTILTRLGVDQRMRCNLKTKRWATGQLRSEHTSKGELPPRAVLAQKCKGTVCHPSDGNSSFRAQPHYSCQQLGWVYTTALHCFGWKAWDGLMKATSKGLFMFRVSHCTVWDEITGVKWLNINK